MILQEHPSAIAKHISVAAGKRWFSRLLRPIKNRKKDALCYIAKHISRATSTFHLFKGLSNLKTLKKNAYCYIAERLSFPQVLLYSVWHIIAGLLSMVILSSCSPRSAHKQPNSTPTSQSAQPSQQETLHTSPPPSHPHFRNIFAVNPMKTEAEYREVYQESVCDHDAFWLHCAHILDWHKFPTSGDASNFRAEVPFVKWFEDGQLNACYNCVDRHAAATPQKTAIIFEPDTPGNTEYISYEKLLERVRLFSRALKRMGVRRGDVVTVYLPMIPEVIYVMLACARIGAIHSVVFSGFSAAALACRLGQAGSNQAEHRSDEPTNFLRSGILVTTRSSARGGRTVQLGQNAEEAIAINNKNGGPAVEQVLFVEDALDGDGAAAQEHEHERAQAPDQSQLSYIDQSDACVPVCATDPLFMLYTSGSTGTPKGVMHSTGGYLVYAATTHRLIFDTQQLPLQQSQQQPDVYFCSADIGWITGHSYGVYGPLANGATLVLFQGIPTYPDASRYWEIISKHRVTIFYTSPTALRSLRRLGDSFVDAAGVDLSSLRVLGSVGEPIDLPTWQ
jgi:acetyl-CoA synthetase